MTEENIRYITNDDIPNVVEPCYITSEGELWQWSIRRNQMMEKSVFYDRSNNTAKVNIMLYDTDTKGRTTKAKTVSVATLVYRYFNGIDLRISKRLDIGHLDRDVMNCRLDNLYLKDVKESPSSLDVEGDKGDELESTPHSGIYEPQNLTEERIRHLTHDDFPDILLPCYITSTGEVWQYSKKYKKVVQKKLMYDRIHNKAIVNLANDRTTAKYDVRPLPLATAVYRYFSGDTSIGHQLNLDYRDGNCMNCHIDNLFKRANRYYRQPRDRYMPTGRGKEKDITEIYGLQHYPQRLMLSDFDSVMTFFEMKKAYPQAAETKLTIDTTDWTAEQLRKLLKIRARLGDTIIK